MTKRDRLTSETNHTPTPWRVGNPTKKSKYGGSLEFTFDIFDANGCRVMTLSGPKGSERSEEIVRAVNAHGAYEEIRNEMKARLRDGIGCDPEDLERYLKAIAKAEGK